MRFVLIASLILAGGSALAQNSTESLRINAFSGNCPRAVNVGIQGDSYAGGVKFTVDIKGLVAQNGRTKIVRIPQAPEVTRFIAPLAASWRGCRGESAYQTLWSNAGYTVKFAGDSVVVDLENSSPSFRIDQTSTFNNQAIFMVSEIM